MIVHHDPENRNQTSLMAAVGKGPARPTPYGTAIDVVRINGGDRRWGDLVPTNPEILAQLIRGQCIETTGVEFINDWQRPMWRGRVRILEH